MNIADFRKNIELAEYTTFKIGGPAKYFFVAKSKDDLLEAVKVAKENKLPYYILGGGSNVLVSDKGFDGLVIKMSNVKCQMSNVTVQAEAGVGLADIVAKAKEENLTGLEWAVGIPGTIGGAVRGNAGAFRQSMQNVVRQVEYWDGQEVKSMDNAQCQYAYRHSIFKENPEWVVLGATLELKQGSADEINKTMKSHVEKRMNIDFVKYPCAGCAFKNGDYSDLIEKTLEKYPDVKQFAQSGVIPAGWMIDQLDLKGKKIGGAQVWQEHANFIINSGKATAKDVITLISYIKEKVRVNFGIQLTEEVQYVGFGSAS